MKIRARAIAGASVAIWSEFVLMYWLVGIMLYSTSPALDLIIEASKELIDWILSVFT